MNEHLMSAVLYSALFFESCTDAECDPDLAVKQLEQIAFELRQLLPAEQDALRRYAHRIDRDSPHATGELRRLVDGLLQSEATD